MFSVFGKKSTVLIGLFAAGLFMQAGCPGGGGANQNLRSVGDEPGGVKVGLGDIAVAPTGDYVIFKGEQELTVGLPGSGEVRKLPVDEPTRLAFAHESDVLYVGSERTGTVRAVDAVKGEVVWEHPVDDAATENLRLAADTQDIRLLAASRQKLDVLDALTGEMIRSFEFSESVVDLKVHPDSRRAIVVLQHEWDTDPNTGVIIIDLKTGDSKRIDVPNCSDLISITGDGAHALMAPTTCHKDPVSVISLDNGNESFVRNLPGFGPVAVAPDGIRAIAFLDTHNVDESLFDDPSQVPSMSTRYHLMVINTNTLKYTFHPYGEMLPRYAVTNDGKVVLVDTTFDSDGGTKLFDLETGTMKPIAGPQVKMNNFVMTSDSEHAFGLKTGAPRASDTAVFHIDIRRSETDFLNAGFMPTNINISADDSHLFLRRSENSICVFDISRETCASNMNLNGEEVDDRYQVQSW